MLRDGLVIDPALINDRFLPEGKLQLGISTIPSSHLLVETYPAEFERIDRERHWAGLAIFKAAQLHKLADLPPDSDPMSLLLRLALQSRVSCRAVPADTLENSRWMVASGADALVQRELALVSENCAKPLWTGPGRALASWIVRRLAPKGLKSGSEIATGVAIGLVLLCAGLAAIGQGAATLGVAALASLAFAFSTSFSQLREGLWAQPMSQRFFKAKDDLIEGLTAIIVIYVSWLFGSLVLHLALPALAMGLSYYIGRSATGLTSAFWRDRFSHLAAFATAAGLGYLEEAIALFALMALCFLLSSLKSGEKAL